MTLNQTDEVIEALLASARELALQLRGDPREPQAWAAALAIKRLRRPEVAVAMDEDRLARVRKRA